MSVLFPYLIKEPEDPKCGKPGRGMTGNYKKLRNLAYQKGKLSRFTILSTRRINKGMTYLLDTSVYSQALKKRPLPVVVERWKEVGDSECCVSVFCEMELLQGIHIAESKALKDLYYTIVKGRIPVLDFTIREAAIYAEIQAALLKQGRKRPVIDLCIAATALSHNCTLVTLNTRDFSDISDLIVEDWSTPI